MCIHGVAPMIIQNKLCKNKHQKCVIASFRGQLLWLGVAGCMALSLNAVYAQDVSLIEQEIQKRQEGVILAQELLLKGDSLYKKGKFGDAVDNYSKAFQMIPRGTLTREVKEAAAERYAQAVVEHAKVLSRTGQYEIARKQLENVLSENVAPGDVGAKKMLSKLDDPIRTSPTLTPEHVNNVVAVGQLLRKAESYHLQGQFDEALVAYEEVIKIDAYNKAARRGMSKVIAEITVSADAAKDQRRAAAMQEVAAQWETPVNSRVDIPVGGEVEGDDLLVEDQLTRNNKVKRMIVPEVNFQNATFAQALRVIRALTRELDTEELDPNLKGVNYVTRFGNEEGGFLTKIKNAKFNLDLRNIPMSTVLDHMTSATGTYWKAERHAIVIRPLGSETNELETRTFRVPVGFMDNGTEEKEEDVFDDSQGGLKAKLTAIEYFKKLGVTFPEGAMALYSKHNNTLRVKNTPRSLDSIETFIRAQSLTEKVQVVIKVTMMEVKENDLSELGFDWLLEPIGDKNLYLGGGTQGNSLSPVEALPGSNNGATFQGAPITSGNRSGDSMIGRDGIDAIVGTTSGAASILPPRAPGILQVTGQISDARYQTIIRAVKQRDDKSQIWSPSVVTSPGQRATIFSGQEMIYPEEYEPGEVPNGGLGLATPPTPTSFTTRDVGMTMEVEPTVSDDKQFIDLNVNPTLSSFQGFVNYGSPIQAGLTDPLTGIIVPTVISNNEILMPVFRTIRTNTNVTIQDGATLVIGGLLQEKIVKVDDKTPILGDLPILGRLFRSDGYRSNKVALIIFVKAELVDPTGQPWRQR